VKIVSYAVTDVGQKRSLNEDSYLDRPDAGLWAVADGVGGADAGEVASSAVTEALAQIPAELSGSDMLAAVRHRIDAVHGELLTLAAERAAGTMIASTVTVLMVQGDHFACLWAGDSRAYLLRNGELRRLTTDHTLVQTMVDDGRITAAEAETHPRANVITRAVGAEEADLDKVIGDVQPGDRFLLCTDGLTKELPEAELAALLAVPDGMSPAELLVEAVRARGARDNVTAVVVVAGQSAMA
jgi:protein phosphatase/serine/threonine-protein phosphatase Stp1